MTPKEKHNRRWFIKSTLIAGTAVGIAAPLIPAPKSEDPDKVTMLTSDGKLVTISKATLEQKSNQPKATEREVYEWMNEKHKS
jgi:hypothetical protein